MRAEPPDVLERYQRWFDDQLDLDYSAAIRMRRERHCCGCRTRRVHIHYSGDRLLRMIRAAGFEPPEAPRVAGIDD